MIITFKDKVTAALFLGLKPKSVSPEIVKRAHAKLALIDAAASLDFLRSPPSNQLEALKDDRKGQHSIRVNQQYRICFIWQDGNAHEVEFCDYH